MEVKPVSELPKEKKKRNRTFSPEQRAALLAQLAKARQKSAEVRRKKIPEAPQPVPKPSEPLPDPLPDKPQPLPEKPQPLPHLSPEKTVFIPISKSMDFFKSYY